MLTLINVKALLRPKLGTYSANFTEKKTTQTISSIYSPA